MGLIIPGPLCEVYMRRSTMATPSLRGTVSCASIPDHQGSCRLIGARWIEWCKPEDLFLLGLALRPKRTPFSCLRRKCRLWPWKQRPALVAARACQRVQMLPRCYLPVQKFPISPFCPKARRNVVVAFWAWFAQWTRKPFGNCTNIYECVAVCPADISGSVMAKMYREYAVASLLENVAD